MHPDCVGVFVFDQSSAHESYADDALNINNMNIGSGGQQRRLHDTMIPLSNPDLAPGKEDTHGHTQKMCFPDDHPNLKLRGQPKGVKIVLKERKSVWDKYTSICDVHNTKIVGKCSSCTKSQVQKDAECRVALVHVMGQDEDISAADLANAEHEVLPITADEWCCMSRVLSL
jgi:hypothetical protein